MSATKPPMHPRTPAQPAAPGGASPARTAAAGGAPAMSATPDSRAMSAMAATAGTANTSAAPSAGATPPPTGVEALADSLSICADELHERIMRAIRQRPPAGSAGRAAQDLAHGITQEDAQSLFDQEVLLRQSANRLYVEAAILATAGLDAVRHDLMDVTAMARDRLRHVAKVQGLVALTADLITLTGALTAGNAAQWPSAIRDVRTRLQSLHDSGKS
jgi:hypothetical protein